MLLGRFISVKEPNIRYLGLEALGRFAQLEQLGDGGLESIKKHQATVFVSLKASKRAKTDGRPLARVQHRPNPSVTYLPQ